jgi:hypothetical protein
MRALSFLLLLMQGLAGAASAEADWTVLPLEASPLVVFVGDTQAAAEIIFTVQYSGPGALRWAVSADASWLELSSTGGQLKPGQQAVTVTARLRNVSQFQIGRYVANVTFTSLNHKLSPIFRQVVLEVRLPAPVLSVEPPFISDNPNTVFWTPVRNANEYEAQVSTTPDFASFVTSGWIPYVNNYTFSELQNGVTYFYRVRCRSNFVAWSQTLAREFAQNQNSNLTTVTSPGDLVLVGNTNRIWIEDFDEPGTGWANTLFIDSSHYPPDPGFVRGPLDETTRAPNTHPPLPINQGGDKEGMLFTVPVIPADRFAYVTNSPANQLGDVTVDAYVGRSQSAGWIEAGIVLRADPTATTIPFPGGSAYFAQVVMSGDDYHWLRFGWMSNSIGDHFPPANPDISFPVESSDENYHLRFSARGPELTASLWSVVATNGIIRESPVRFLGNGTNVLTASDTRFSRGIVGIVGENSSLLTDFAFFDDVTIRADEFPPSYAPSGSSTATVAPANWVHWGELAFTTATPPGTSLTVDVLDSTDALLAADVPSGTELDSLPGVASQPTLRLRANFLSADPSLTPTLSDWTINFPAPAHNPTESPWSGIVSSTIDTSPPRLTITSPEDDFITSTNVVTFTGTASDEISGVLRVRVRTVTTATTTNAYANWTANAPLSPGTNIFVIAATDNAVPANVTALMRRVIYQP